MLREWMPLTLAMILLLVGAAACQKATTTEQSDTTTDTMSMTTQEKMDIFLTRRSIRKYKAELPPQELLDKVLEAGTYAPSAMGKQSVTIVAVTNRAVRDQLSQLANKARGGELPTRWCSGGGQYAECRSRARSRHLLDQCS